MAYAFVQGYFDAPATGVGSTFPSGNTAGNSIMVAASFGSASTPTISDTRGNSYTLVKQQAWAGGAGSLCVWAVHGITAGANTVTLTLAAQSFDAIYLEYSGLASTDKSAGNAASSTDPNSGSTATTTSANEMVFGVAASNSASPAAGAGFTSRANGVNNVFVRGIDKRVTATGTYSADFTETSSSWGCVVVTFAESGGVATVARRLGLLGVG